ncbi:MAG: TlpA family protein disulfide reductase [Planctomycetota bacterium]|nr:TlpA family protein disulfide reductase [Planctomycetota bacterium]
MNGKIRMTLFALALLAGCGAAPDRAPQASTPEKPAAPPAAAPDAVEPGTELAEADFEKTLKASGARFVLVQVFAEKCGPCMEEARKLTAMQPKLKSLDAVVIGVGVDEKPKNVKQFYEDTGRVVTYPLYCAPWFAPKHEIEYTPTLFIYGADGKRLFRLDPDALDGEQDPLEIVLEKLEELRKGA